MKTQPRFETTTAAHIEALPEVPPFVDRREAGRLVADRLGFLKSRHDVVVLGVTTGAMGVAAEVADALDAPLDVLFARPLQVPGPSELVIGAVTASGSRSLDAAGLAAAKVPDWTADLLAEEDSREATRVECWLRENHCSPDLHDRVAVLVDDGLATGDQLRAAVADVAAQRAAWICVASPVLARPVIERLDALGADCTSLFEDERERRGADSYWYLAGGTTSLVEVRRILAAARHRTCPEWSELG